MPIHLLDKTSYKGRVGPTVYQGLGTDLYKEARLEIPGEDEFAHAHLKLYQDGKTDKQMPYPFRGMINELVGYLLAEAACLSVPENAGFIDLDGQIWWWSQMADRKSLNATLEYEDELDDQIKAILVTRMKAIALLFPDLKKIIAFDNLIANIDRNTGNVLPGEHDTILIDHGLCLTGATWTPTSLRDSINNRFPNVLSDLCRPESARVKFVSEVQRETDSIAGVLIGEGIPVVEEHLVDIVNSNELNAIVDFLKGRANNEAQAKPLELRS